MKNIISLFALALVYLVSSCGKSFIEKIPVSSVTIDALYKTDKDFQDAVIGTYHGLRNQYANMWQFGDLRGDDAFIQVTNQPSSTAVDVFSLNSSDALLRNTWANYYIAINRANTILARIANADVAVVKNKDRYIGEARFLRAVAYFDLVRIFGDVQMITTVPTIEETAATPRTPVATVYAEVIIKDLLDAAVKLPRVNTGTEVGRATRGAAKGMLGKVYLTIKDFPKAEAVLQELTAAPYTYALLSNYNDLFDYSKNEHHSEYIFDIEYEEGLGGLGSIFTNNFMPNVTALLDYYNIKGGFNESLSPTKLFVDLWQAGDKRKDVGVQCCGSWRNPATGAVTTFNSTTSQSYTMKYVTSVATRNDSRANWKVIRYADVLLMLAEALNENGKTAAALVPLNQVRTRAGLPAYAGLTQTETRDNVALERRFELCFEGHRWFDLVRTGKALSALAPVGMKDYMTVFPVPLSQVQVMNNPALFSQNPGYN
ncbi:MAG: RagB/SusD family nutrient uptake outer membrane protein [Chitinophagaceae bacterium]